MDRWKAYIAAAEAERRRAERFPAYEPQPTAPPPMESPDVGAPWFPDCEPYPRAT